MRAHLLVTILIMGVIASSVLAFPPAHAATGTSFDNIVIIAMENTGYQDVIGSSSQAPFINSQLVPVSANLAHFQGYGAAGRSVNGCSAGCYTALIGADNSISDGYSCCLPGPTIVDRMAPAGLTWQAYCESGCPRGNDHFPFTGFATTSNSPNIFTSGSVSTTNFIAAANSANPPNLLWYTPTDGHNMHDNSVSSGDTYVQSFLVGSGTVSSPSAGSLLASSLFTSGKRVLLLLWWDECGASNGGSGCNSNGDTPNVWYGPHAGIISGFTSQVNNAYDEYSILHLIENNWALSSINSIDGAAQTMTDIFGSSTPPPLTTSFTVSPSTPIVNLPVTFTATTTGGKSPYTISWNFGDGSTGTGASLTHIFLGLQSYTVTETATDSSSPTQTATNSKTITITSPPPLSASFSYLPASPVVNSPVTFTATTTGGTAPYTVSWNFGDGATGTGVIVTHTFAAVQSFTVTETATDSSTPAQTVSSSKTVSVVTSPPLSTSFTFLPTNPTVNSPVSFTAVTTGGSIPYTISWNFGDGATATGATATHTYATAQSFTVTETATDSSSPQQTATTSHTVVVSASITGNFDNTWFINNCPGGTETISNGVLQTRQSTPGGGSNSYGYCTGQRGTFPWHSTVGTALPPGITTVTVSFNFLSRSLLSGSRYHLYVALYYQIPSSTSGGTTYPWLDTQSRDENIGGVNSQVGSTATYDPGDSFGWDIVTLQMDPGQSGIITADATQLCQGDLAAWGLPANTQCTLMGIEIGTEGYQLNSVNVDWYNVNLNIGPVPLSTSFLVSPNGALINKPVIFTATTIGGTSPYTINWNFGDGSTGTGASVTHTYSSAQSYTVTETATDSASQTATSSKTVTVSTPPPLSTSFTFQPANPVVNTPVTFTSTTSGGTTPYTINWSFGDGASGTGTSIVHTFTGAQSFSVTETVTDSSSPSQAATSTKTVTVSPPPPPSTSFTSQPSSPIVNTPVTFTATTTGGSAPYSVVWNFGDGSSGTGASIVHTFTSAQSFTVTETVTDSSSPSQTATSSKIVTVSPPPPPSTSFTFQPSSPIVNTPVTFTATATGGTAPYSITWNFGDGSTGTGASVVHTFTSVQSFTVTETVMDSSSPSQSATSSKTVIVQPIPPLSTSFTFLPTTPLVNAPVTFTAVTTGGTLPYVVTWNFGDGATGTGAATTHSYTTAGTFTVTETATDSSPTVKTATSSQPVTVYLILPLSISSFQASNYSPQVGQSITFTGLATGGTAPYTYSIAFGDGASRARSSSTHTYSIAGSYTATLTVTDSASAQATVSSSITITVLANPPTLNIPGNQTVIAGTWINFTVTAASSNIGGGITFSATGLPVGASFDQATGGFSWKPSASQTGSYVVVFTTTDSSSPSTPTSKPMEIHVNQAAPGGPSGGNGGSGGSSSGGCLFCGVIPKVSTTLSLLMVGGLLGLVASLALLTIKARASLEQTKRRMKRLTREE